MANLADLENIEMTELNSFSDRATADKVLEFSQVTYTASATKLKLLNNFSRSFYAGERYLLSGVNGSGKSSFMQLAAKLQAPQSGTVVHAASLLAAGKVVYMAQLQELNSSLPFTVQELLQNTSVFFKQRARLLDLLDYFDLHLLLKQQFNHLSGGEKALVLLCRALLPPAGLYFFDESFAHLDASKRLRAVTALAEWLTPQALVFLVDHNLSLSELKSLEQANSALNTYSSWQTLYFPLGTATLSSAAERAEMPEEAADNCR